MNELLTEPILDWLRESLGGNARIRALRRLNGATSSTLYALDVQRGESVEGYVLRLFTNTDWLAEEPDVPAHEASALGKLHAAGLPVPGLAALDAQGERCGLPALLMTRLAGRVHLTPADQDAWLRQLAEFLPRLHAVPLGDHAWKHQPYNHLETLQAPDWSPRRDLWEAAVRIGRQPFPAFEPRFIHRDYHPVNVLFEGERLSGVVDWPNACSGPAGVDVAHCRLNLAHMYGLAAADRFLALCQETMRGYWQYEPFWDLLSILDGVYGAPDVYPPWLEFGLTDLTAGLMAERGEIYLASVLARF